MIYIIVLETTLPLGYSPIKMIIDGIRTLSSMIVLIYSPSI